MTQKRKCRQLKYIYVIPKQIMQINEGNIILIVNAQVHNSDVYEYRQGEEKLGHKRCCSGAIPGSLLENKDPSQGACFTPFTLTIWGYKGRNLDQPQVSGKHSICCAISGHPEIDS